VGGSLLEDLDFLDLDFLDLVFLDFLLPERLRRGPLGILLEIGLISLFKTVRLITALLDLIGLPLEFSSMRDLAGRILMGTLFLVVELRRTGMVDPATVLRNVALGSLLRCPDAFMEKYPPSFPLKMRCLLESKYLVDSDIYIYTEINIPLHKTYAEFPLIIYP